MVVPRKLVQVVARCAQVGDQRPDGNALTGPRVCSPAWVAVPLRIDVPLDQILVLDTVPSPGLGHDSPLGRPSVLPRSRTGRQSEHSQWVFWSAADAGQNR